MKALAESNEATLYSRAGVRGQFGSVTLRAQRQLVGPTGMEVEAGLDEANRLRDGGASGVVGLW